jgi:HemY protein
VKRKLALLAVILLALIGLVAYLRHRLLTVHDPGYVIIGYGQWAMESSLVVVIAALTLAFVLFYALIRVVIHALRLPRILRRRGHELRTRRSQEALITGLIEAAEGNWEKAEKNLIRHAADSGIPLIHYLTAARAAHIRGAVEQRDEYLKLAHETLPEAEIAIGLTRAELHLSNREFEQALESLTQLDQIAPSHAAVLKMLHQVYAQMEDWEGLRRLLPSLHSNKVMMEAEIKLLETETYSALLRQRAAERNPETLRQLWQEIPEHLRKTPGMESLFFAAMIEAGAGTEVEAEIRASLERQWNETIVVLYGCIEAADPEHQLAEARKWLHHRPDDAILLRVLGKLAWRAGRAEEAKAYLQRSLEFEPSVETYRLLGDLSLTGGDTPSACTFFRQGLLLASREVVSQIEQNPSGTSATPAVEET